MEILISGDVTNAEISEIQNEFSDIIIRKHETKSIDVSDVVNFVFRGFDSISFSRDFFLSFFITSLTRKVLNFLKGKNKVVGNLWFILSFIKSNGKEKVINFYCSSDNYSEMFEEADKILNSEIIDNFPDDKLISIQFTNHILEIKQL